MQTQKMSLANIKGKLSRHEMKTIMAGVNESGCIEKGQNCNRNDICCPTKEKCPSQEAATC